MNDLFTADELVETDIGKYRKIFAEHFVTGKIDIASSGAAYLMNDDYEDDIYISPRNVNTALNGDTVTILLHAKKSGKRLSGEVTEIVERSKTEFVGLIQVSNKFAFLVPDSQKMDVDIMIPLDDLNDAKHGQKAIAKITDWNVETHNPIGEVVQVLGEPGDNETEMHAILVEYGFPLDFPKKVYEETSKIAHKIPAAEIKKRKDFRGVCTFTIDPEDAKDFDDAISFEKLSNGNYSIGVHIADVTHYVREDTHLNDEAVRRATSVYLVDRVIPMLPEKISNEVCSLRPKEDKLCFSAVFEMNENAEVVNEWFGRTVIHSTQRFTYQQAQDVIEKKSDVLEEEIHTINTLAQKLRKQRFKSGAINFESIEVKFRLDETGYPKGVYIKEHKESNELIEEFMLLANRKVAEFVGKKTANDKSEKKKAFVYRIHDVPKTDKLESFAAFANKFGYRVHTSNDSQISKSMNGLMKDVKGKKEQNVLEKLAIRTMSKAVYSTENIGHYGLAFDFYTHFTSPIRRYPDMMVHRLLQHYLDGGKSVDANEY
ncbi:MAG: VacB/RNase II family 3'-5' exoribonuclease, partial [Bacteroidia bacterium]|nr:VacB/RNase II family 3'-5' exoribonuclease [Bacteroidia bacterium]